MTEAHRIDLHMHTTVSDGTDTPEEIVGRVKENGIKLFAVTDHDAIKGCGVIQRLRKPEDPQFLTGVEGISQAVDGLDLPLRRIEFHTEVLDLQDGFRLTHHILTKPFPWSDRSVPRSKKAGGDLYPLAYHIRQQIASYFALPTVQAPSALDLPPPQE